MMSKKILIVDDLIFARELIKSFVEGRQYTILTATNGMEALKIAREKMPDLVIMDLYMPEMNGDEACRIIKSNPALSHIPVIMTTSAWNHEEKQRCNEAGCDDFIIKPYKTDVMLEKLSNYIPLTQREEPRFDIDGEVSFNFHSGLYLGKALNISLSGMCVDTKKHLPLGSKTDLALWLKEADISINAEVEIVRTLEVRNESAIDSSWRVGVKFSKTPFGLRRGLSTLGSA